MLAGEIDRLVRQVCPADVARSIGSVVGHTLAERDLQR